MQNLESHEPLCCNQIWTCIVFNHYFTKMSNGKSLCSQRKEIVNHVYKYFVRLEKCSAVCGTLKKVQTPPVSELLWILLCAKKVAS